MSPWVDDPETGTSHYERPKNRPRKSKPGSLADLAAQFNAAQGDRPVTLPADAVALVDKELYSLAAPMIPGLYLWYGGPIGSWKKAK